LKLFNLNDFTKGWFIGHFEPTLLDTEQFECAVKRYKKGDKESSHMHKVATEYTIIVDGSVRMNGEVYCSDSIIEIVPGEITDFEALTDVITCVIKVPGVKNDKYVIGEKYD
jgi:mannose-6-phosphate isomerase-like protein (cupin superfamily)